MNNVVCCVTEKQSQIKFTRLDSCTCKKAHTQTQAFKSVRAIISLNLIRVTTITLESLTRSQILPLIVFAFLVLSFKKASRLFISEECLTRNLLFQFSLQLLISVQCTSNCLSCSCLVSAIFFARGHFFPCINNSPRSSVQ